MHIFPDSSSIATQQKHKHSRTLFLYHPFSMLLGYVLKLQDGIHIFCKPYYRILLAWSMKPFFAKSVLEAKEMKKQRIWLGALPMPWKNFPSWQQPKSFSIDHKPTCLFFLIGKLMSIVVSNKIHTYIWAREEWSSSQEFWFSLTDSLATNLLNCS
jgi:hypothetical protein